jgi:ribose 5-phosphate isomerase A
MVSAMTVAIDPAKDAVGRAAAQLVEPGMRLGLGSGSTFLRFLEHLGTRIRDEGLDVVGVPSSEGTAARARELSVSLTTLDDLDSVDLTIDGADEVDPAKHMIKGGGAALAREKIIAAAAGEMIVMVSESKMVDRLGRTFLLPVEVMPFGWRQVAARLRGFDCEPGLRMRGEQPLLTDNDNFILDCNFADGIADPVELERAINLIPGVLDNGLFTNMAGRVLIADPQGNIRVVS